MAKFHGMIGFGQEVEERPGYWKERVEEREYFGELNRNTRRLTGTDQVNQSLTVTNEISFVADPYARENFHMIRYACFMGTRWEVTSVEVQYPRLVLTLGGVYNAAPA